MIALSLSISGDIKQLILQIVVVKLHHQHTALALSHPCFVKCVIDGSSQLTSKTHSSWPKSKTWFRRLLPVSVSVNLWQNFDKVQIYIFSFFIRINLILVLHMPGPDFCKIVNNDYAGISQRKVFFSKFKLFVQQCKIAKHMKFVFIVSSYGILSIAISWNRLKVDILHFFFG